MELRLRTIETPDTVSHVLTFKEAAIEEASGSKPEHETIVADPSAVAHVLEALGCETIVEFTKDCENYGFSYDGQGMLATVVQVAEASGTFLEVETQAEEAEIDDALATIRRVLGELGVARADLTMELYTDMVRAARNG